MKNHMTKLLMGLALLAGISGTPMQAMASALDAKLQAFLEDEQTQITVIRYFNESDQVLARVKATGADGTIKRIGLPITGGVSEAGWSFDNVAKTATQLFIANVDVNRDDFFRQSAPYNGEPIPFTPLESTTESDRKWTRADGSILSEYLSDAGNILYLMVSKEVRTSMPDCALYERSFQELSQWKMKKRHTIATYGREQIQRELTKLAPTGEVQENTNTLVYNLRFKSRKDYPSQQGDVQTFQAIPQGYQIVG